MHLPLFYFLLAERKQHRKWEGVASFFGIIALGYRKPTLVQGGYVCWRRFWISVTEDVAKLYPKRLNFATTSLGMVPLSFCFGGSCFAKKKCQMILEGRGVKGFRHACVVLQRMLFLEWGGVPVFSSTVHETFALVCPLLSEQM